MGTRLGFSPTTVLIEGFAAPSLDAVGAMADRVHIAWKEAGREGRARIVALTYFSLGDAVEASRGYLLDYYAPMGAATADLIAGNALRSSNRSPTRSRPTPPSASTS
jgi:hypothetical protein